MKIFVVHYKKLVARRQALEQRLREEGLEAQFVDQYDRDTITPEDRRLFDNGIDWLRFRRRMAPVQVAISLSHAWCFREAADLPTPTLVLEDDALLAQGFAQGLARCLADLSSGWDLLFLGDGCGFHIPQAMQVAGKSVHPKGREATPWGGAGATRCTDSYVMTPRAAAELRDEFFTSGREVDQPIDWWMNDAIRRRALDVSWAEPTLVTQGSQTALYGSSYSR